MLSAILHWLRPPVFPEDEDKTRVAIALNAILIICVGGALVYIVFIMSVARSEIKSIAFSLFPLMLMTVLWALMRSGKVYLASILFVSLSWLNLTIAAIVDGYGIRGTSLYGHVLIVIVAGLLINWRASVVFALLNVASGLLMIYAATEGLLPPRTVSQTDFTIWSANAVFSVSAAFVLGITLKSLHNAIQRAFVSESHYRMLFEAAPDGILIVDQNNQIIMANSAIYQMTGYSPSDVIQHSPLDFVAPDDLIIRPPRSLRELKTAGPNKRERTLIHKDGSRLQVIISSSYMPDGQFQYIIQDVTEQKRIERELLLSEERYRLVSSVISDYTFSNIQNERGEIVLNWVAGAFEQLSGYTLEEFNARGGWISTVYPDDLEQDARDMEALGRNQKVISEIRTIHKDGTIRWMKSYAHPVWNESEHKLVGIYGAVQDVTERKQIEQEREKLIKDLEAKNQELEQFTYTVSHDLKAPLITIKGFLGFLGVDARAGDEKRVEADIQRINEATDRMHELLTGLLELSRIGRLMNPPEMILFQPLVTDAIQLTEGRLQERGIGLIVNEDLPSVYGDRQRLLEVLQNLVDNAAKFMGDQPTPLLEIGLHSEKYDGFATFYIRDNGIGVAPEFHERIFGLFNRLNPKIDGTGIGLTLVKRIIEFHGGRIWLQSQVGEGTTFYFTLPMGPS